MPLCIGWRMFSDQPLKCGLPAGYLTLLLMFAPWLPVNTVVLAKKTWHHRTCFALLCCIYIYDCYSSASKVLYLAWRDLASTAGMHGFKSYWKHVWTEQRQQKRWCNFSIEMSRWESWAYYLKASFSYYLGISKLLIHVHQSYRPCSS